MNKFALIVQDELAKIEQGLNETVTSDNEIKLAINDFITGASKRIRSILTLLYLKANNVIITHNIALVLIAGEIMHNASLLHDDVIDEAKVRRGKLTINEVYSSKTAILSGDYLISQAVCNLLEVGDTNIISIFLDCAKTMSEAEMKQFLLKGKIPELPEYIEICKGKTASLFSAIFKSSAILSSINIEYAQNFSEKFGIVFQIKNDLEPISNANDKKNRIYTAKDIIGVEKTNYLIDNYKEEMREIINKLPSNKYRRGLEDLIKEL